MKIRFSTILYTLLLTLGTLTATTSLYAQTGAQPGPQQTTTHHPQGHHCKCHKHSPKKTCNKINKSTAMQRKNEETLAWMFNAHAKEDNGNHPESYNSENHKTYNHSADLAQNTPKQKGHSVNGGWVGPGYYPMQTDCYWIPGHYVHKDTWIPGHRTC